jgi:hypothetical protein
MLNWPSWEERRKGGEGRIEDGRPSRAKNAIAPVVGAGRPLCLDGKGSGDTQDEPRDHWHVLTDRLVVCARCGGSGATRPPPPLPPLGFRVPGCALFGHQPLLMPQAPMHPYPGHRTPHLKGPMCPFPGLTLVLFFSVSPAGPSLPSGRRNSISSFSSQHPSPPRPPWWTSLPPASKTWRSLPILGAGALPRDYGSLA